MYLIYLAQGLAHSKQSIRVGPQMENFRHLLRLSQFTFAFSDSWWEWEVEAGEWERQGGNMPEFSGLYWASLFIAITS